MEKNMEEESKFLKIFGLSFTVIGGALLIIGILFCINIFNYENVEETIGVITEMKLTRDSDGDRTYDVYVAYEVDGEVYESMLNGYISNFKKGKEIDIYYDKDDPNQIGMKALDRLMLIFPGISSVFFVIGIIILVLRRIKISSEKNLKRTGEVIYVDYLETRFNNAIEINGRNPYNIICEGVDPADGQRRTFKSRNIYFDPENIIRAREIKSFAVYIDRKNRKKYVVDLDVLK